MISNLSLDLYKKMYLIRRAEELIIRHYPEDEMKTPMHMSTGQEAVAVAVCHALGYEGQIFGFYRSHAVFLAKTEDPDRFFGELYGKVVGTARGKAGSMHLAAPDKGFMCASAVVASSIPLAVGAAFANKQKRNERICCAYFGDGAIEEGVFWESLNAACVMRLPVLFVCEDNGFAVHSRPEVRHGFKHMTEIVRQYECGVFQENSTDVEVLYQRTVEAIESAKLNARPSFLHLHCYRYLGHIGITEDFDVGYRSKAEYEEWYKRDPIALQRRSLLSNGWTEAMLTAEEEKIDAQIEESVLKAKAAPFPAPEELYKGVFHEEP